MDIDSSWKLVKSLGNQSSPIHRYFVKSGDTVNSQPKDINPALSKKFFLVSEMQKKTFAWLLSKMSTDDGLWGFLL